VLGRRCVELLGEGDVMRPGRWDADGSHVHAEIGWMVLEPTRLAVLDHGLVTRMNP
jgi:CRP/FNR family cyclic AMP-dependent transcriptional regulator